MAGLPQGGETPVGFSFLNQIKVFCPHFHFLGTKDFYIFCLLESIVCHFKTTT